MKKNSLFSFSLYREALRQLRVFAIVPLIFMFIAVAVVFAAETIEVLKENVSGQITAETALLNPLLPFTFAFCAPMMVLVLFHFLNNRSKSDFYHAVPQPRQAVAISFFAAAVTWIVILALLPTLCGALLCRFFLFKWMTVDMTLVFSDILNTIVLSLLIMATVFLGMTVTGTVFSNILVGLLILFLPRFFLTVITAVFSYDIIPSATMVFPFGDYNMLFNLVSLKGSLYPFNGPVLLYTAVLAVVYFLFGLLLFKRRPSEAAGNPAPSRRLQALHRITLTCSIAFPLTVLFVNDPPTDAEIFLLYIVGYIVSIVVYFMYELLSTRTVRNMVKIIPGLLIVAVACVAGTLISEAVFTSLLNDIPKAENVRQIYIEDMGDPGYDYRAGLGGDETPYFNSRLAKLPITDKAAVSIACTSLQQIVDNIKQNDFSGLYGSCWAKVRFVNQNGHQITRLMSITEEQQTTLKQALSTAKGYTAVYTELPEFHSRFATWCEDIPTEQRQQLYNSLRDELKTVNTEEWISYIAEGQTNIAFATLSVTIPKNGRNLALDLPIDTLTPKTLKLAQKLFYANFDAESFKTKMHATDAMTQGDLENFSCHLNISKVKNGANEEAINADSIDATIWNLLQSEAFEKTMNDAEKLAKIKEWNALIDYMADHAMAEFDVTKPYLNVSFFYMDYKTDWDYHGNFYLSMDGDKIPKELWGISQFSTYASIENGEIVYTESDESMMYED